MTEIFKFKDHPYDLRENNCIVRRIIKSCKNVCAIVWNLGVKLSDILSKNIKKCLQDFKDKINLRTPLNCPCKLSNTYVANAGYV